MSPYTYGYGGSFTTLGKLLNYYLWNCNWAVCVCSGRSAVFVLEITLHHISAYFIRSHLLISLRQTTPQNEVCCLHPRKWDVTETHLGSSPNVVIHPTGTELYYYTISEEYRHYKQMQPNFTIYCNTLLVLWWHGLIQTYKWFTREHGVMKITMKMVCCRQQIILIPFGWIFSNILRHIFT